MITDIPHSGEDVSYGVLIKYDKRYDYFKPMFESNRLAFQATISQYLNRVARNSSLQRESELKGENIHLEAFKDLEFVYLFIPVGIIVFIGILFEVLRKGRKRDARRILKEGERSEFDLG